MRATRGIGTVPSASLTEMNDRMKTAEGKRPTFHTTEVISSDSSNLYPIPELRPRDMLSFAFQIAKGMKYLSDLKVWYNFIRTESEDKMPRLYIIV